MPPPVVGTAGPVPSEVPEAAAQARAARLLGIYEPTLRRHRAAAQATLRDGLDARDFADGP
jgi:hypothetical protein